MHIAVLGWYGHDNAGDERIKFCLDQFLKNLGGINTIEFFDLHTEACKGKSHKFDSYDLVIIGGGGLILSGHNYHDFILGINTKILTLGVSVETELKGNPKRFAQSLIEKSSVVLVRDRASYEKLKNLYSSDKIRASADLTFLCPYDLTTENPQELVGINLFAKIDPHQKLLRLRKTFTKIGLGFYPKAMNFKGLIKTLQKSHSLLAIPFYCEKKASHLPTYQLNDIVFMQQYLDHVPKTFRHNDLDKCCVLLSMRFHGLVFALQKGIPALTFSAYPKQINFMKEMGLEDNVIDLMKLVDTHKKLMSVEGNIKIIKEKMNAYRSWAVQNIQENVVDALNIALK